MKNHHWPPPKETIDEFSSMLREGPEVRPGWGPCLLWTGRTDKDGYGTMHAGGTPYRAHRFALQLQIGPLPKGLCALHVCDVPGCCRSDHLFAGTIAENNADSAAKGRRRWSSDHAYRKNPELMRGRTLGDANGARKYPERLLTGGARSHVYPKKHSDEVVARVVALLCQGLSQRKVAAIVGIPRPTVQSIALGRGRYHVTHGERSGRTREQWRQDLKRMWSTIRRPVHLATNEERQAAMDAAGERREGP